jgi:hypothetical protein
MTTNSLETHLTKSLDAVRRAKIGRISKVGDEFEVALSFKHVNAETPDEIIRYDKVISCCGFRIDSSIFGEGFKPLLDEKGTFPLLRPDYES